MPEWMHSSTPYWIKGLSTSGSISFGCALVAGRKRVPKPAAGQTALRTLGIINPIVRELRLAINRKDQAMLSMRSIESGEVRNGSRGEIMRKRKLGKSNFEVSANTKIIFDDRTGGFLQT